jgi:hypothetical protein
LEDIFNNMVDYKKKARAISDVSEDVATVDLSD